MGDFTVKQALILGLFLVSAHRTWAKYEWMPPAKVCDSIHNYTPKPFNGVPPPMPKLPDQYTMSVQANILQKSWSSEVVEYYDGPNNRASVYLTFNGTTTQTIFNYHTMETYDIYPDGTCKARGGRAGYFGFFHMDRNHRPVKSTVYEMFHMGPQQNFTYVGNTWVRGILVNHWTSCQEWSDFGARFQVDYYFSHDDYQTAYGTGQSPIRAVVNGSAGNTDGDHKPMFGRHKFEHVYDFTSFNVGPIKDLTVFQQPHDVVCTGRNDFKSMPTIPDNFQMDMEMNCPVMGSSMPFQHSLRYDWEHRLVENSMSIPSPQGSMAEMKKKLMESHGKGMAGLFDVDKMVMRGMRSVDDHKTGLRYVTETANNTCRVSPIPDEKEAGPMDHGKSLFDIHMGQKSGQSPFTYQGKSTFRNIPVDVWGVDNDGMIQKVFFMADHREPTLLKNKEDGHSPWSGGRWNQGQDETTPSPNARSKRASGSSNRPRFPSGRPRPTGYPRPTAGSAKNQDDSSTNKPAWMRAMQNAMKGRETNKPTDAPNSDGSKSRHEKMMDFLNKHKERMQGNSNDENSDEIKPVNMGPGGKTTMVHPKSLFPVLVGIVFRNRTAISTRNMPLFFQEIMKPELINWKEAMAKDYLDQAKNQNEKQKDDGEDILDKHAMMENMHNKMMRHAGEMDTNVFHFQPLHTDDTMFQVAHCYEPEQTSHVLLHVPTNFRSNVQRYQSEFTLAMRKAIAEAMGVSFIQISNLKPEPHIDTAKKIDATYVSFSLLGSPPVKAPKMKPPSISEAKRKLIQAIKNGITFKVNYPTHTKSFMVDTRQYSVDRRIFQMPASDDATMGKMKTSKGDSDSDNYSESSVAGIAIGTLLLGFIMAIGVFIVLRKRKYPDEPVIPYKITKD